MRNLKILLFTVIAICFSVVALAQKTKCKTKTSQAFSEVYDCQMKCEGEKAYAKAGDCPVCGMHLEPYKMPLLSYAPWRGREIKNTPWRAHGLSAI